MKDKERLTPLDYSCKFGSWDLADLLIGITRPISLASNEDNLPLSLHYAISNKTETTLETVKMVETVKKMLEIIKKSGSQILNQSLNAKYHNDYTLLHISIENNYFDLAKLLIEDYNNRTNIPAGLDKNLPIHLTAMTGSIQMFDLLVKHRSKINTTNAKNENCLHLAAISNKPKFIEHFLKVELDIYKENLCYKATNLLQFTPLMAASYSGSLDSIKILTGPNIAYDLADKDIDDHCIFHLCAKKNQLKCLKYLIDSLLVNDDSLIHYLGQKDKYDNTILHIICANGFYDMLVYILEKISKNLNLIFRKNYYEESCFHLCCKEGHERIAR
jgi:ankyrin repeat protein